MASYGTIAGPGLALNSDFINANPQTLTMSKAAFDKQYTITTPDGQVLFTLEVERYSRHHKRHLIDARSGQAILTIRRRTGFLVSPSEYYVEIPDKSGNLILTTSRPSMFSGVALLVDFVNAVNPKPRASMERLEVIAHSFSRSYEVMYGRQQVADVNFEGIIGARMTLRIAGGIDPILIIVLASIRDDIVKSRNRSGAAAGGAAAGAGGGGG